MIKRTFGIVATVCMAAAGRGTALAQRGMGKTGSNALHTGDDIKVKLPPARDGSTPGFLNTVIMPDGRLCMWTKLRISAGNPNE